MNPNARTIMDTYCEVDGIESIDRTLTKDEYWNLTDDMEVREQVVAEWYVGHYRRKLRKVVRR